MKSTKRPRMMEFSPRSPFLRFRLALSLSLMESRGSLRRGRSFLSGYCRWREGFDGMRRVIEAGKVLQTMDHGHLPKHFAVESK